MKTKITIAAAVASLVVIFVFSAIISSRLAHSPSEPSSVGGNIQNNLPPPPDSSNDLQTILKMSGSDATGEQVKEYSLLVTNLAENTTTVTLAKDCAVNPIAARMKAGSELILKNTDKVSHTIHVNAEHVYTLAANATIQVKVDFGQGIGIYGYACDDNKGNIGVLQVIE